MEKIISDIPLSSDWKIVRLIDEGWSADKKYYIKDKEKYYSYVNIKTENIRQKNFCIHLLSHYKLQMRAFHRS